METCIIILANSLYVCINTVRMTINYVHYVSELFQVECSMNLDFIFDREFDFPVIVIDRFGETEFEPPIYELLIAYAAKTVAIDARTRLRAGVIRPRIIFPERQ